MSTTLHEKLASLPKARRARIMARAAELEAEEMSLRVLRQARKLTQQRLAKKMGVAQGNVSRIETRKDVLLSTLGHYVEAMGGRLNVTVEFPDRPAVRLVDHVASSSRSVATRARTRTKRAPVNTHKTAR
jgi:DNA-binding XRE family transcriptional regulator